MTRLIAFDLETTGLDPEQDRIMEFCFLELDAGLEPRGEPFTALVDPQRPIPPKVQEITGITPDMVAGRPPFSHHAGRIQRLVEGAVLIAHNHRFDVPFLHHELMRAGQKGLDPNHPAVDTCSIERIVNSHGLEATYRRYTGNDMAGAHRSLPDTQATVEVLRAQLAHHSGILGTTDPTRLVQPYLARLRDPEAEVREWLDHGHRFYRDAEGVVRFGFGKHRDEPVSDHEGFLRWMKTRDFPVDTLAWADRLLEQMLGGPATAAGVPDRGAASLAGRARP